jgi:hypothetical protein
VHAHHPLRARRGDELVDGEGLTALAVSGIAATARDTTATRKGARERDNAALRHVGTAAAFDERVGQLFQRRSEHEAQERVLPREGAAGRAVQRACVQCDVVGEQTEHAHGECAGQCGEKVEKGVREEGGHDAALRRARGGEVPLRRDAIIYHTNATTCEPRTQPTPQRAADAESPQLVEDRRMPKAVERVCHVDECDGQARVPFDGALLNVGTKAKRVVVAREAGAEAVLRGVEAWAGDGDETREKDALEHFDHHRRERDGSPRRHVGGVRALAFEEERRVGRAPNRRQHAVRKRRVEEGGEGGDERGRRVAHEVRGEGVGPVGTIEARLRKRQRYLLLRDRRVAQFFDAVVAVDACGVRLAVVALAEQQCIARVRRE